VTGKNQRKIVRPELLRREFFSWHPLARSTSSSRSRSGSCRNTLEVGIEVGSSRLDSSPKARVALLHRRLQADPPPVTRRSQSARHIHARFRRGAQCPASGRTVRPEPENPKPPCRCNFSQSWVIPPGVPGPRPDTAKGLTEPWRGGRGRQRRNRATSLGCFMYAESALACRSQPDRLLLEHRHGD